MIDMIANNLPPAVTFKPFAEYIQKLAQSGNWADRRGAVIALGVTFHCVNTHGNHGYLGNC